LLDLRGLLDRRRRAKPASAGAELPGQLERLRLGWRAEVC